MPLGNIPWEGAASEELEPVELPDRRSPLLPARDEDGDSDTKAHCLFRDIGIRHAVFWKEFFIV